MGIKKTKKNLLLQALVILLTCFLSCKKEETGDVAKVKPPVRSYVVTARIDKKGTNTNSDGTAVLHGVYSEETKVLSYDLEYKDIVPQLITLRSGAKGTAGTLVKDIFVSGTREALKGTYVLTPLQERNLLKGLWFVAVNTTGITPDISGVLTLKQK